jgi:hypothetical protein
VQELIDRKVDVIRADVDNTVQSLTSRLHKDEGGDGGFPVVIMEDGLFKVTGYISDNELEHALSEFNHFYSVILCFLILHR